MTDDRASRLPEGFWLLATAVAAVLAFQLTPAGREARALTDHGILLACSLIAWIIVSRHDRTEQGWEGGRALGAALALTALGSAALVVSDVVAEPRLGTSAWDIGFLVFLVAVLIPVRAEFVDHLRREDRREISIDVALIVGSLAFLGYLFMRPDGADAVSSMSTLVFATIAATMFTAFAALLLWVPTLAHVIQFLVFSGFAASTVRLGTLWVRDDYQGADPAVVLPLGLGMLLLAAAVTFLPERARIGPVEAPTRWGRPLLTSVSVAAACAALGVVGGLHRTYGMDGRQSTVVIVVLAIGIAIRIVVNQVRSTKATVQARLALQEKEAALAETDAALDRVREGSDTLRRSEEHLRMVFDTAVDGIVEMDEGDVIQRANEAFCSMVGLAREVIEGQSWSVLAAAVAGSDDSFATLPDTGQGTIARQGQPLYLESRISKIPTDPPRQLLLVRDVTAGRIADQTIRSLFQFLQDRDEDRTRLMRRTNAAIEAERNRIARDLHDGPVQGVSAASLSLEAALLMIKAGETDRGREVLGKIRRELSEEAEGLRRLMSGLRPPLLEERGLIPALRETITRFGHDRDVATEFTGDIPQQVPRDLETLAYRVVQEALSNAGKHAKASRVSVVVTGEDANLRIEIADDGVGFDAQQAREFLRMGRVGLASMRERVELANGSFLIHSTPGRGTTLTATLPIEGAPLQEFAADSA